MLMMSPSSTTPMGPPEAASGETWPTHAPRVAPLKRPSVMSATLFPTEADREAFNARHHREHVHIGTLEDASGPHFLGIDAGSTTIKATLVNDDREIV